MENTITELFKIVEDRKGTPQEGSYTSYLFEKGLDKILKKVGESHRSYYKCKGRR